ncbi:MAG: hypothetical protein CMP57_00910 [Flavobacteriales bacterium]|nr:hypothetical protein [Flavobacteriales bacterium]
MKKLLITLITFQVTFSFAQDPLTPCQQAQLNASGLIGEFVPNCQEDGSYVSTQCWASAEYCWCVDEDGEEIPGTSILSWQGMPDCSSNSDACTLIPDPGMCEAAIQKYYFNQETQQCEDFSWGGCGGVVPFESLAECEAAACSQSSNDCCINAEWINPTAMCPFIWDPVSGCDGIEYANSCVAQAAGLSSWTNQSGSETTLNWDCEPQSDSTSCEAYFEWGGGNPYLVFSNLSNYSEIDPENINLLWDFGNGYTTFSENPVYTYDSAGYYEVCLTISVDDTQNNQTCISTYCDFISYMVPGTTWDCGPWGCYNPGTGMGQYTSIDICEATCNITPAICTSTSGIEISSLGFWENPNDPCDTGECTADGQFLEIVIDCEQEMGIPCEGEWMDVEGQCCSVCVPSNNSYCDSISLNPILPLGATWGPSVLEVNVETYFSNYSIPYAGLMLIDNSGDTIAIETISTAGNVYGIFPNMSETRELLIVNELVLPFTGELCIVEGLFAGITNIVCSYPVIWQNMELDEIQIKPRLLRMIDILGRDVKIHQSGQFLFYIYDDGTVEKKYTY